MPGHYKETDMKKKYAGKKFTPLFGRGTAEERENTRNFAKDLDENRKAKNKKRIEALKKLLPKKKSDKPRKRKLKAQRK
tara:strand:+ start:191 stop:427 length:237 start_codon:yes stop_codon:yes gene_type:complete